MEQSLMDKLTILADSAKYDVACTSSGASHPAKRGTIGSCYAPGCCHAFTAVPTRLSISRFASATTSSVARLTAE